MAHFIDAETLQVVANVPVGERPRHAEFTADGSRVWVSAEIGGTVTVIDTAKRKAVGTIGFEVRGVPSDQIQPVGMRLTRDGSLAFVALGPANRVAIVDARSFAVLGYLLVGRRVWHLAMTPEEDLLFTTNGVLGDVSVIDVKARRVVKSIKVGRFPWGAAVRAVP
jgi:PQQ-dependent catabolism-associated beta-propeller protein